MNIRYQTVQAYQIIAIKVTAKMLFVKMELCLNNQEILVSTLKEINKFVKVLAFKFKVSFAMKLVDH